MEAAKTIAQAFISCRLDYCNSLLYSISDSLIQRLQSVQNAAARLVTGTQRSDHTPVLRQLHWLPVRQRIHIKIACCVFQAMTGQATAYLADDCRLILGPSQTPLLELVSPPPLESPRDSVTEVFRLLVDKFGMVYPPALRDFTFDFKGGFKTCLFTLVWWDLQRLVTIDFWRYINLRYLCM